MASRVFRSTDVDAPSMTCDVAGSLNTILKAVLVNGYGATVSLGYSLEFEDALENVCVFRQSEGTRFYIRIDDNGQGTTIKTAEVVVYESMEDVNIGISPCPSYSISDTYKHITKRYEAATYNNEWIIIGDEKGFWMFLSMYDPADATHKNLYAITYIGDYIPIDLTNQHYNFCTVLGRDTSLVYFTPENSTACNVMRNPKTFEKESVPFFPITWGLGLQSGWGRNQDMSPVNGRWIYEVPLMCVNDIYTVIGSLPGLLNPLTSNNPYDMIPFFEIIGEDSILHINTHYAAVNTNQYTRMTILTGEKFRNAY